MTSHAMSTVDGPCTHAASSFNAVSHSIIMMDVCPLKNRSSFRSVDSSSPVPLSYLAAVHDEAAASSVRDETDTV
jgi:hypothetical protein